MVMVVVVVMLPFWVSVAISVIFLVHRRSGTGSR